jgi:hypothetical protein
MKYLRITMIAIALAAASVGPGVSVVNRSSPESNGRLRQRLVRVDEHSRKQSSANSFWVAQTGLNRPFTYLSH